jgi:Domain of unknown function (DUF4062)
MANEIQKQYLPIFVGSTFVDLQNYRAAVCDALHRLETIVRGMEYFGSKPGNPTEECLNVVRSSKVYIGIFGMRYGSIPDDRELSMTQLEYEEAQSLGLPSLIYLIDENNQPVLPKYVETGSGADKLRNLKSLLQKRHLVSYFITEEDLAAKILHDLPPLLEKLGTKIEGTLEIEDGTKTKELLAKFQVLPKLWRGKEITIKFVTKTDGRGFTSFGDDRADALGLEVGGSVVDYLDVDGSGWYIYGENRIAVQLIDLPQSVTVTARVVTIFGVSADAVFTEDGVIRRSESHMGLLLKEIVSVTPTLSK